MSGINFTSAYDLSIFLAGGNAMSITGHKHYCQFKMSGGRLQYREKSCSTRTQWYEKNSIRLAEVGFTFVSLKDADTLFDNNGKQTVEVDLSEIKELKERLARLEGGK